MTMVSAIKASLQRSFGRKMLWRAGLKRMIDAWAAAAIAGHERRAALAALGQLDPGCSPTRAAALPFGLLTGVVLLTTTEIVGVRKCTTLVPDGNFYFCMAGCGLRAAAAPIRYAASFSGASQGASSRGGGLPAF